MADRKLRREFKTAVIGDEAVSCNTEVFSMDDIKVVTRSVASINESASATNEVAARKQATNPEPSKTAQNTRAEDTVSVKENKNEKGKATKELNQDVNFLSVLDDNYKEIGKMLSEIGELGAQAEKLSGSGSPELQLVQERANALSRELGEKTRSLEQGKRVDPFEDDEIREIQQRMGATLEAIFPPKNLGGGEISFDVSARDTIVSAIANAMKAKNVIDNISSEIAAATNEIATRNTAQAEVAAANQEASEATVRDVDAALTLANESLGGVQNLGTVHSTLEPDRVAALLSDG